MIKWTTSNSIGVEFNEKGAINSMFEQLWMELKKKNFAPLYFLYGPETFLIEETKQLMIKEGLTEEELDFNLSSYDLEETPIEIALEDAETFPFFGERKFVFLHNPFFLTAEKNKSKVEHDVKKLENYIMEPASYTSIIFIGHFDKTDDRKKIVKELKRQAKVVEASRLNEQDLKKWLVRRANFQKVQILPEAIDLIIKLSGTNLSILTSEVDKLALYVGEKETITPEVVELLVTRSLEQNIFALTEKIVEKNREEAISIYRDLLLQKEEPIKILAAISSSLRIIYQTKELSRRGYSQNQIASHLKVHPYRIKLAMGQAQKFSEEEIMKIMQSLATADYQMKTGGMNKELIIELILLQLK